MDKNKPDIEKTPSTNKIILDYLLYLSIQSRLKQASIELLELSFPLPKEQETLLERKKRWIESATRAEQDKNAVESVVTGILSHHCHKPLDFKHDCHFEQRLHVCQLTNLSLVDLMPRDMFNAVVIVIEPTTFRTMCSVNQFSPLSVDAIVSKVVLDVVYLHCHAPTGLIEPFRRL
ncbi:unnamed protein product [Rhizopus stolonifer]